jgi:two-component system alkaline phosphatase synthesis response regulator PhoP
MADKILVVDDELTLVNTIRAYLEQEGYTVSTAHDGRTALQAAHTLHPDLIVLDVMLPGLDGFELLRLLRQDNDPHLRQVYVLMLTAKAEETDKVIGLTLGADDYLTKPFSPRELVARVKAILRRGRSATPVSSELPFRHLRLDPETRLAWKDGTPLDLTPIEFELLHVLARHRGVLSREQLMEQVWGYDFYGDDRTVDVHIGRLRKKVEDDPTNPIFILTVWGVGYRFGDEPA